MKKKFLITFFSIIFLSLIFQQAGTQRTLPRPGRCADLIIRKIIMDPVDPTISTNITFKVIVMNIGQFPALPSKLAIRVGGETTPKIYRVPDLGPNDTHTVLRVQRLTVPRKYRVTATADFSKSVMECREDNNTSHIDFTVTRARCPDLVVINVTLSPANPTTADTIRVDFTVKNIGNMDAKPVEVSCKIGPYESWVLFSRISPNQSVSSYGIHKADDFRPNHSYYAVIFADKPGNVTECNERNNIRRIRFKITE